MEPDLKGEAGLPFRVGQGTWKACTAWRIASVMRQLAAAQASPEQVPRVLWRSHLITCVSEARQQGRGSTGSTNWSAPSSTHPSRRRGGYAHVSLTPEVGSVTATWLDGVWTRLILRIGIERHSSEGWVTRHAE